MPPQVKVSKEQIKNTAFQMTCENGFESVTARKLADRLNCSTQPIFRVYENMEALKRDLYDMGAEYAREKMLKQEQTYLSTGMAYIELAKNEAHLFRLIAAVDDLGIKGDGDFLLKGEAERIEGFLPGAEGLSDEEKRGLLTTVWLLVHGIATLVVSDRIDLSDDEMRGYITQTYNGLLHELKGNKAGGMA